MRVPLITTACAIVAGTALFWTGKETLTAHAAGTNDVDIVAVNGFMWSIARRVMAQTLKGRRTGAARARTGDCLRRHMMKQVIPGITRTACCLTIPNSAAKL